MVNQDNLTLRIRIRSGLSGWIFWCREVMKQGAQMLAAIEQSDSRPAGLSLPWVSDESRLLAAARMSVKKPGRTLDATALIHEAYLRLIGDRNAMALTTFRRIGGSHAA